jgi:hypothetical protein
MVCDQAEDRTLQLSLGLFGAPAGQDERPRESPVGDGREDADRDESGRDR